MNRTLAIEPKSGIDRPGRARFEARDRSRQGSRPTDRLAETREGAGNLDLAGHRFADLQTGVPQALPTPAESGDRTFACPLASGPRVCPFGGACHACPLRVQAVPAIGSADDPYEREADRVAELVMKTPGASSEVQPPSRRLSASAPQRQAEEEEEEEMLQPSRKPGTAAGPSPEAVSRAQGLVTRDAGEPLPSRVQDYFGSRLGFDFAGVRVHANGEASASARAIRARAYTLRNNVVFSEGEYSPRTASGLRLLAHELTHVVQQSAVPRARGRIQRLPRPRSSSPPATPTSTVTINITVLDGATDHSSRDLSTSNRIFRNASCGIRVAAGNHETLNTTETGAILGADNRLEEPSGPTVSAEEQTLVTHNRGAGRLTAYYVPAFDPNKRGTSLQAPRHGVPDSLLMGAAAAEDTFTHELGHVLGRDPSHHRDGDNLMASGRIRNVGVDNVTPEQCRGFLTATAYPGGGGAAPAPSPSPKGDFPLPSGNTRFA